MYYVADLESRRIVCYPDGGRKLYWREDQARDYALVLQQNNPGAFCVVDAENQGNASLGRAICVLGNATKIRAD